MIKCKIKIKKNKKEIIFQEKGLEKLRKDQLEIVQMKGKELLFLSVDLEKKRKVCKLIYNFTGYIQLSDFIKTPIDKDTFALILKNILEVSKNVQTQGLQESNIIFDISYIMINPAIKNLKLYFIYLPLKNQWMDTGKKSLISQIIGNAVYIRENEDDMNYVNELLSILKEGTQLKTSSLEQYVKRILDNDSFRKNQKKCSFCKGEFDAKMLSCPYCGNKIQAEYIDIVYNPNRIDEREEEPTNIGPRTFRNTNEELTTQMLKNEEKIQLYLIHQSTHEEIYIDKFPYTIGRSFQCDYTFSKDKISISRIHAQIDVENDNRFYITDKKSSFGTFLNDKKLEPNIRNRIGAGDIIKIVDEEFRISYKED
ncbi:MAG: FHA domain-containing protein [Lachnospiraceae bacterium]